MNLLVVVALLLAVLAGIGAIAAPAELLRFFVALLGVAVVLLAIGQF